MTTTETPTRERADVEVPAAVLRHMEAEHRQDVEGAVAEFTDDCYYRVPGLGLHMRGKDEIRRWYAETFAAVPDFSSSDERYWPCEARGERFVLYEARMEGTQRGTWHGWAPTGRRFSTPMLVRIPIAPDGLMLAEEVFFDSTDLFTQLGVVPPRGSRAERVLQLLHAASLRLRGAGR